MRTSVIGMLSASLVVVLATPAVGQTLAQRIAAVKQKQAAREAQAKQKPQQVRLRLLQTLFYQQLTVDFDHTEARDVFNYLSTTLDLNLVVRYRDDPTGHGIDPETPITISVSDIPAIDVFELVLEQCAATEPCTWQLRESFIEVGTKDRLGEPAAQFVRIYPIDDLLFEPPRFGHALSVGFHITQRSCGDPYSGVGGGFGGSGGHGGTGSRTGSVRYPSTNDPNAKKAKHAQQIIELITETVEPLAWNRNGGAWANIRYLDGALIVRGPEFIHRQIGGYGKIPPPLKKSSKDSIKKPRTTTANSTNS